MLGLGRRRVRCEGQAQASARLRCTSERQEGRTADAQSAAREARARPCTGPRRTPRRARARGAPRRPRPGTHRSPEPRTGAPTGAASRARSGQTGSRALLARGSAHGTRSERVEGSVSRRIHGPRQAEARMEAGGRRTVRPHSLSLATSTPSSSRAPRSQLPCPTAPSPLATPSLTPTSDLSFSRRCASASRARSCAAESGTDDDACEPAVGAGRSSAESALTMYGASWAQARSSTLTCVRGGEGGRARREKESATVWPVDARVFWHSPSLPFPRVEHDV